jgi:IMP dehydrogenase
MSFSEQALEVDKVKKSESGMILNPITMHPDQKIHEALEIMKKYRISGLPITKDGKLVGILTNRDLRFEKRLDERISTVMTKDHLITVPLGTTLEASKEILHKNRIEKLLVVDEDNNLKGLITIKDIEKMRKYPHSCKDHLGGLRVGVRSVLERTEKKGLKRSFGPEWMSWSSILPTAIRKMSWIAFVIAKRIFQSVSSLWVM